MARVDQQRRTVPSVRLVQILRTYCQDLDPSGIEDLRASLKSGHYPWFADDFAAAVTETGLGPEWWTDAVGDHRIVGGRQGRDPTGSAQRMLWRSLYPNAPWPGRAMTASAPSRTRAKKSIMTEGRARRP